MGGEKVLSFRSCFLFCLTLCSLVLVTGLSSTAMAQDEDEFVLEEIVVTGSRIARNNNESNSPIITVDEKLFDESATLAIETQLNKLPQFTPTIDVPQIAGQDIQPNARNTPGEATVALRGIGTNRTLVLINGRRGTPSNALGVVDINTIPTAAIEYVEAISGGASSTYGADAMAGVLNFIMRDHFEGFQLDIQSGITEEGDNFEYQISGIMGSNIADDRGNVSVAFSYNDREEAYQRDRDWYRELWANPTIGGTQYFAPQTGFITDYANAPSVDVMNSVIDGATFTEFNPATFTGGTGGIEVYDDGNGNAFTGIGLNGYTGRPGTSGADIADGYRYIMQNNGQYGVNNVDTFLIYPLERYNMYANGNYKINEYVGVFGQAYFSRTAAKTHQEGVSITNGWTASVDPTINRDVIPAELLAILDSRPNPDDEFILRGVLPYPRGTETDVFTYNMTVGLEGEIPQLDWTWEAFINHGEAETTVLMTGFASLQRFAAILNSGPNFGQGVTLTGNQGINNGFGASTATCTSGLNPFDWGSVSQDCWDAVLANVKTKQLMEQNIYEANAQGHIVDLPMGEMLGALGASYRENIYEYQNDTLVTSGMSFLEQAMGLYPSGNSDGKIEVKEFYAELLVPLLSDIPGIKNLDLELGGRRSDYNTTGTSYTYKALLDYRANDYVRFRGGYNRAERAPNIAELFLAEEQTFGFNSGDPASTASPLAYSANPATNPEHWQDSLRLQGQLMEMADPDADLTYYGVDYREILAAGNTDLVSTTQSNTAFGSDFHYTEGNSDLTPEKADTWTLGVVIDSPIKNIPALMDWRLSLDYYQIKVKDAIGQESSDLVMRRCIDPLFNPTFDINSPYCDAYVRNPDGQLGALRTSFQNSGRFETSGIDLNINWGMDLGPGRLGIDTMVNYLIAVKSSELDILPLVDYVGTFGPTENGLNGYSFEWRTLTTFNYTVGDLRVSLRWQHLDSLEAASAATGTSNTTPADAYDMFDLMGSYNWTNEITLRFGIENVFGIEPDLYGINYSAYDGMYGGSFETANQDVNGRRFYIGARVYF